MDRKEVVHQLVQLYALQPERLSKQVRIEQALRQAITQQWPAGLRLPSHRQLADALGVARQTLALAIHTLLEEALLKTAHGQGTWTCRPVTPSL
ncbi:MAG: GntR family transcriptional regulator, partial [Halomonas sp.]